LAVCGSVSTLAFSLAQRLGCSPIVLVGQDLAYTNGQTYANGTPYEGSRVKLSADGSQIEHERSAALKATNGKLISKEPLLPAVAWGGQGTVHSTFGFSAVRSWFELAADVLRYDRPDQRLVNATEGGGRIAGFEELTLAEVLAPLPELGITAASLAEAAKAAQPPHSPAQLSSWLERQLEGARATRHAARRVRRLCRAAEEAVQSDDPRRITRSYAKLEGAERALRTAVATSPFVDGYSWTEVDDAMRESKLDGDDALQSAERATAAESRVASAIERCSKELEQKLAALIESFGAPAP
jgi:hypothetical protein